MKKEIFLAIACMIFIAGMSGCASPDPKQGAAASPASELALSGKLEDGVRVIPVTARQYHYDPDPIVVAAGEKVKLVVTSSDVSHGLAINEYNVNLTFDSKTTKTAEFIADKKGTFEIHCSVFCGLGHFGMHGKLIVR